MVVTMLNDGLETLRAETGATDTSNFKNAVDADDFLLPLHRTIDSAGRYCKRGRWCLFEPYAIDRYAENFKQAYWAEIFCGSK